MVARSVAMRERERGERRDFKHTLRSETTFSTIPFLFYGGGGDMQMKTCDFGRERERERERERRLCWVNCSERKNKERERTTERNKRG